MRAGQLRREVEYQRPSTTIDTYGQLENSWTLINTMWASIETIAGSDIVIASELVGVVTHRVKIRYRQGVTPDDRLVYTNCPDCPRVFEIASVDNWHERDIFLVLLCKEVMT